MPDSSAITTTAPQITLWEAVDNVQCWLDTIDAIDDEAAKAEALASFHEQMEVLVRKVDSFAEYLLRCEAEQRFLSEEIERFQVRKRQWLARQQRLEAFAAGILRSLPEPKKGARKLEGQRHALSLRAGKPSVLITDEAAVPSRFKTLTVTLPATAWEKHIELVKRMTAECATHDSGFEHDPELACVQVLDAITKTDCSVPKGPVAAAIKAGETIPGADMRMGEETVVVK